MKPTFCICGKKAKQDYWTIISENGGGISSACKYLFCSLTCMHEWSDPIRVAWLHKQPGYENE